MKIALWTPSAESIVLPGTKLPAYVVLPFMICLVYAPFLPYAIGFTAIVWWMTKKGYNTFWLFRRIAGKFHGNRVSSRPIWVIRRFAYQNDLGSSQPRVFEPYRKEGTTAKKAKK